MKLKFRNLIQSSRGAALITILGFSVVIFAILQSLLFDSKAEHISAQHNLNELRARYSARSGIEINLLRVMMYRQSQALIGDQSTSEFIRPYLDFLWNFPLMWPLPVLESQSQAEKDEVKALLNRSFLKSGYNSIILPEDGKIDLNDLSSPIPYLQQFTFDMVLGLLNFTVENDKKLEDTYQSDDILEIVNNIADWTDPDNESRNGGSELTVEESKIPLNRSFIFLEEIKKVPKVTDQIYEILKSHITVYGSKGLNINYASAEVLQAFHFSDQAIEVILSRTQQGSLSYAPFSNKESFCHFMQEQALDICDALKTKYKTDEMLQFNTALHFRIESSGQSRKSSSQAETLIFDAYRLSGHYKKAIETHQKILKEERGEYSNPNSRVQPPQKPHAQKINYNSASPVFIMYWKENF